MGKGVERKLPRSDHRDSQITSSSSSSSSLNEKERKGTADLLTSEVKQDDKSPITKNENKKKLKAKTRGVSLTLEWTIGKKNPPSDYEEEDLQRLSIAFMQYKFYSFTTPNK